MNASTFSDIESPSETIRSSIGGISRLRDDSDSQQPPNWWALLCLPLVLITAGGNVLVCVAIARERRLQNMTNYFLMSLAITDMAVAVLVMPLGIVVLVLGYFPLPPICCMLWTLLDVLFCTASIMHLCTLSVDRYLSLSFPIRFGRHKTLRRVWLKLVPVWLLSLSQSVPLSLMYARDHRAVLVNGVCGVPEPLFQLVGSVVCFYIPLMVMLVTYALTVRMLNRKQVELGGCSPPQPPAVPRTVVMPPPGSLFGAAWWRQLVARVTSKCAVEEIECTDFSVGMSNPASASLGGRRAVVRCAPPEASAELASSHRRYDDSEVSGRDSSPRPATPPTSSESSTPRRRIVFGGDSCHPPLARSPSSLRREAARRRRLARSDQLSSSPASRRVSLPRAWSTGADSVCSADSAVSLHYRRLSCVTSPDAETASAPSAPGSPKSAHLRSLPYLPSPQFEHPKHPEQWEFSEHSARLCGSPRSQGSQRSRQSQSPSHPPYPVPRNRSVSTALCRLLPPTIRSSISEDGTVLTSLHANGLTSGSDSRLDALKPSGKVSLLVRLHSVRGSALFRATTGLKASQLRATYGGTGTRPSLRAEQKATKVLGIIFFTFVLLWSPFFIINIVAPLCESCRPFITAGVINFVTWLGYSSSLVNPIFYTLFNKTFRNAFVRILQCQRS